MPPRPLRRSDLIRELSAPDNAPPDPSRIHRFLAKLPRAFAEGLITREDLRCYRYLSQVMLEIANDCQPGKPRKSPAHKNILEAQHVFDDEPIPSELENDHLLTYPARS